MSRRALLRDGRHVRVADDHTAHAAAARAISRRVQRRWVAVRDIDGAIYVPASDIINVSTI